MNKLYLYIDETYNLQNKNHFYAFAGFVCKDTDKMKSEYKKILRKCKAIKYEVKSNDKISEKIRNKIIKNVYLNNNIEFISISQLKNNSMNYKYFEKNVYSQEVIFYQELLKILLLKTLNEYKNEIDISIQVEVDEIKKIKIDFYNNLKENLKKSCNLKWLDLEIVDSKLSLGLQLADQIAGICREYIKENSYSDFVKEFKINIENPLSKN